MPNGWCIFLIKTLRLLQVLCLNHIHECYADVHVAWAISKLAYSSISVRMSCLLWTQYISLCNILIVVWPVRSSVRIPCPCQILATHFPSSHHLPRPVPTYQRTSWFLHWLSPNSRYNGYLLLWRGIRTECGGYGDNMWRGWFWSIWYLDWSGPSMRTWELSVQVCACSMIVSWSVGVCLSIAACMYLVNLDVVASIIICSIPSFISLCIAYSLVCSNHLLTPELYH